ncbi:MAG TPA: glycosyltransferase family 1 protein [Chitinophagaceae bacterium]|jgi:glycosyltransferase involved in cell wall biosynthesis
MAGKQMRVVFLQRKVRKVGNYSVEMIFEDVRMRLANDISTTTCYSRYESSGLFKRLFNCLEAAFRQGDVNHVTGDINYIGFFLSRRRTIHTILDCVFLERSSGLKHSVLKLFWLTIPVRRSRFITAISEATKKEILKYSNCDPAKIVVVPVAISQRFTRSDKTFNKSRPVILHVGTAPNKNLSCLINALKGIPCQLHIIGKREDGYIEQLKENGIDYVYQSGLSDDEMLQKYRDADIMAFASTYEGFGMPILEAQATGRVVVTSNLSSMPEVAGDAACLVDPYDEASVRKGIVKVIEDDAYRDDLVQKGFENIKRYNPGLIARQYLALYKKIKNN